jgi:hypothetical protein
MFQVGTELFPPCSERVRASGLAQDAVSCTIHEMPCRAISWSCDAVAESAEPAEPAELGVVAKAASSKTGSEVGAT